MSAWPNIMLGASHMSAAISIMWESTINCRPFDTGSYPSVVYWTINIGLPS